MQRKSLLKPSTSGASSSNGLVSVGRVTDFIAMADHADLMDPSKFSFTEHLNREGARVFELNNPVTSSVRQIASEEPPDSEYDYCVAFFNRRTKQTEFKPVSFLRVAPKNKKEIETSGLLEGKRKRSLVDYTLNKKLTAEEVQQQRQSLTMDFGNARKRKMLDAATRRKIDDGSMSIMNDSLLGDTTMDQSTSTNGSLNDSKQSVANEISLLKTPTSIVLPKMNMEAKGPSEVFSLDTFFMADDLKLFVYAARPFFKEHKTVESLVGMGVPKFVARKAIDSFGRGDLYAASAFKMITLSMIYPGTKPTKTKRTPSALGFLPQDCVPSIEREFCGDKIMRDGNFNLDKLKKDKMLAHIVGFYFALSTANQYEIAVGWIMSELNVTEMAAKKILQDVGCTIREASREEITKMNTTYMAQLVGPVRLAKGRRSFRR